MSSIAVGISLPEIIALISAELSTQDLNSCVQVSRSWHEAFIPYLYHQVSYSYKRYAKPVSRTHSSSQEKQQQQQERLQPQHHGCSYEGFRKHGRHIRILHVTAIEFPELDVFGPDCQRLTALHLHPINQPKGEPLPQWNLQLQALIARNPKIQTLELHSVHRKPCEGIFFDLNILRVLPELKRLTLMDSFAVNNDAFDEILACGPQLQELNYQISLLMPRTTVRDENGTSKKKEKEHGSVVIANTTNDCSPMMWTKLTSLTVSDQVASRATELIERCPNLKTLYMRLWNDDNTEAILRQLLWHRSMGYPSRLEHLRLYRLLKNGSLLVDLLQVCNESSRLKTFWIDSCVASHKVMTELLKFHAESLEKVVLMFPLHEGKKSGTGSGSKGRRSSVQDLLVLCPRLRHLEVGLSDKVYMEDLVQSPWVCRDIEHLELQINGRGMMADRQEEGEEDEEEALSSSSSSSSSDGDLPFGPCFGEESLTAQTAVDLDVNIELQRQLWQQIGALTLLRKLHIHADMNVDKGTSTLSVTHGGLEALCKLHRLVELKVSRGKHILTDSDREILLQRMPNVRIIHPR
ncbi:hypothetical protein BGX34_003939 [Mortierella sp. NVP85]|nr:hypothetical protein BGX34_003939 [Mortierella sp. NVP85]